MDSPASRRPASQAARAAQHGRAAPAARCPAPGRFAGRTPAVLARRQARHTKRPRTAKNQWGPGRCENHHMLRLTSQVLLLLGVLSAAAGLVVERRSGKRRIQKAPFIMLVTVLLLLGIGTAV